MRASFLAGVAVFAIGSLALGLAWPQLAVAEDEYDLVKCDHEGISLGYREGVAGRCASLAWSLGLLRAGLAVAALVAVIGAAVIVRSSEREAL